jgi:hypothetical protein
MHRDSAAVRNAAGGSVAGALLLVFASCVSAETRTWDGRYSTEQIEVTAVYFVPQDRTPLPDWRERVDYYCRRVEQFHRREFSGQSTLTLRVHAEPLRSGRTTEQLRAGDANFIVFQTLGEVHGKLKFGPAERAFPVLLVLSDINWRPLEDFYRLSPKEGKLQFEGQVIKSRHFPGSPFGGARAVYLAERGVGWGLISADGWRVPYSGSDCVVYHEGIGHAIGLPHPQPNNNSVMSLAQYRGWINESWLDKEQKSKLGWKPEEKSESSHDLFTTFRALPHPLVPRPGEGVRLDLELPAEAKIKACQVRIQTDLFGPWLEISNGAAEQASGADQARGVDQARSVALGKFERATPVSYRVNVELTNGDAAELWGYFQVRSTPDQPPLPVDPRQLPSEPPPEIAAPASQETKGEKAGEGQR